MSYSPLYMTPDDPLGNTVGVDGKQALHVKIKNTALEPIAVIAGHGIPHFLETQTTTTPGVLQTLLTETVGLGISSREYVACVVSCRQPGIFTVLLGAALVGSGRVDAGRPDAVFVWRVARPANPGQTLQVKFLAEAGSPAATIEAYIQAQDIA